MPPRSRGTTRRSAARPQPGLTMGFLVPLFLAALGALAVPVLLHVRRQIPKERVPFSAVMFLSDDAPRTRRRMRLQDVLLLLLRCLALALLAFAFARPFFGSDSLFATRPAAERFILVDTSASMRGERFERAKRAAADAVDAAAPEEVVAVASFDRTLSVRLSFETSEKLAPAERRAAAKAAITALEPGWFDTDLGTLSAAADLADQARPSADTPIEMTVVSDFQKSARTSDLASAAWPRQTRVTPVAIGEDRWTNAGVHPLPARTGDASVRIGNSTGSEAETFTLIAPGAEPRPVEIAPGQSREMSVGSVDSPQRIDLQGDPFDFDNHAWIAATRPATLTVDYFGPAREDDSKDTLYFLSRALQPASDYTVNLRVRPTDTRTTPTLTVIDGDPTDTVKQRLAAGGNVLLLLRNEKSSRALSTLAGAAVTSPESDGNQPVQFGEIDFKHPIFSAFADPRFSNFSRIHTWHYRRLDSSKLPGAQVLASFSSGDPFLVSLPVGAGTLDILTTTWRPEDSQLALSTKFAPLLHAIVERSADLGERRTQLWVGDEIRLGSGASQQSVTTPSGQSLPAANGVFSKTDWPGVYRTADGARLFAVNVRPSESELTPLSLAELRGLGLPLEKGGQPAATTEASRRALATEELEQKQKWWWWLLAAALVLFIAESGLAAWTTKHRTPVPA